MCFLLHKWTDSGLAEIEGTILEKSKEEMEMAKK